MIVDGRVKHANLKRINLDEKWLREKMAMYGVKDFNDVLFASIDTTGEIYCQVKEVFEESCRK